VSAVHGWYPVEVNARARLWRHRRLVRALERGDLVYHDAKRDKRGRIVVPAFKPWDAVLLVTHPKEKLLEASLGAVRERQEGAE
jgi:hypothetical protein